MTTPPVPNAKLGRGARNTLFACLGTVVLMTGAAFAAVPLYNIFCKATGFDGTPRVGTPNSGQVVDRTINVRFDTNVSSGLEWSFKPEQPSVDVKPGETQTVFFHVKNEGKKAQTGIAAFNVEPGQVGAYFVKLKCFCFDDQTLQPGESADFPVVFYVDSDIQKDRSLDELSMITLSYTYFVSKNGLPVTTADGGTSQPKL